jgi:hypothetical protein
MEGDLLSLVFEGSADPLGQNDLALKLVAYLPEIDPDLTRRMDQAAACSLERAKLRGDPHRPESQAGWADSEQGFSPGNQTWVTRQHWPEGMGKS